MGDVHYKTLPPLAWAMLALVVINFGMTAHLLNRLKRVHSGMWDELGQPGLFWNNSIRNGFRVTVFIWSKQYRLLDDPKLNRWVWALRVVQILCVGSLIAASFLPYP